MTVQETENGTPRSAVGPVGFPFLSGGASEPLSGFVSCRPVGKELLSGLDGPVGESGLSGASTACRVLGAVGLGCYNYNKLFI